MPPLSPTSAQALARLRAFVPPASTIYSSLPLSRRAAVLVLLFAGRNGELRVVLTIRANTLNSFPGQAAFPGGKADSLTETPFETARREAFEEIGLPLNDKNLPAPFRIEHICQLPLNLARTALGVRPCVAFLHSDGGDGSSNNNVEESLMPKLDSREVAAVFTAPFHNFLKEEDEEVVGDVGGKWYEGSWTHWHGQWRMHNFYVPILPGNIAATGARRQGSPSSDSKPGRSSKNKGNKEEILVNEATRAGLVTRHKVWGMTARILVDAARIAYEEEPEFEHSATFGDEALLQELLDHGQLPEKVPGVQEDLRTMPPRNETKI